MPFKPYTTRKTNVPDLGQVQEDIRDAYNPVLKKEILDGNLVTGSVTPAQTAVAHKLDRVPRGWFVVSGQASIIAQSKASDSKFIYVSSAGGTEDVTFWVF